MEISRIEPFLRLLSRQRARTLRVFACVPPEQIEWSPAPGRFSFGDLLRHLAGVERFVYAEVALGRPSRYPGHGPELAEGLDATLAFADLLHRETLDALATLTPETLQSKVRSPTGALMRAASWLRLMPEHEAHHRGQIYLMLGLLGIETPPLFGLTSEELADLAAR
ncbi:MAG: DinB family protein [Bacteroidota bacterium]